MGYALLWGKKWSTGLKDMMVSLPVKFPCQPGDRLYPGDRENDRGMKSESHYINYPQLSSTTR